MPDCIFCLLLELAERMRREGPLAALGDYMTPDQQVAAAELLRERPPEPAKHAAAANAMKPRRGNVTDEMLITVLVRVALLEGPQKMQASFCPQHRVLFTALSSATGIPEHRAEQVRRQRQN